MVSVVCADLQPRAGRGFPVPVSARAGGVPGQHLPRLRRGPQRGRGGEAGGRHVHDGGQLRPGPGRGQVTTHTVILSCSAGKDVNESSHLLKKKCELSLTPSMNYELS